MATLDQLQDSSLHTKAPRSSNLELLRIVAMLAIIAHHYVVNSTVTELFIYDGAATPKQYFLEVYGMWGKTGINAFILLSGYFMCKMDLTLKRYLKLVVQILFYGITIMLIFRICGYQQITIKDIASKLLGIFMQINNGFTASFLCFYAFTPIYNKLISVLSKEQLLQLSIGLLFVMSFCSTILFAPTMNEPVWYMTLYFVAAYIRLYPNKWTNSLTLSLYILITSIIIAVIICLTLVYLSNTTGRPGFSAFKWHFIADSNKILSFIIGLSAFLTAKNIEIKHSKIINGLAAGCFGVLLIHASSDTMRRWLWLDIINVPGIFKNSSILTLIIQAITVPLIIFLVCSFIDHYYKKFLEPMFMRCIFRTHRKE